MSWMSILELCIVWYFILIVCTDIIGWVLFSLSLLPRGHLTVSTILGTIIFAVLMTPSTWGKILYNNLLAVLIHGKSFWNTHLKNK